MTESLPIGKCSIPHDIIGDFGRHVFTMSVATTLSLAEGKISINLQTGNVTLAEGLDLDAASKLFWGAVLQAFPQAYIVGPGNLSPCKP